MIYFIQDDGLNLIKIGFTEAADATERLRSLQTGSAAGLTLLCTMPGDRAQEARLHQQFASARVQGEWFKPVPALILFIARNYPRPAPAVAVDLDAVAFLREALALCLGRLEDPQPGQYSSDSFDADIASAHMALEYSRPEPSPCLTRPAPTFV